MNSKDDRPGDGLDVFWRAGGALIGDDSIAAVLDLDRWGEDNQE